MTDEINVPEEAQLWVERKSGADYRGYNRRGAQVRMGPHGGEGVFTPGELLQIALAGCAGLSTEAPLTRRVGDSPRIITVSGDYSEQENRFTGFQEQLLVNFSLLDAEDREKIATVIERAVHRQCTVARTLKPGAGVNLAVQDASAE
jgi:uncharacterized OsmC-like protein